MPGGKFMLTKAQAKTFSNVNWLQNLRELKNQNTKFFSSHLNICGTDFLIRLFKWKFEKLLKKQRIKTENKIVDDKV